MHKPNFGVVTLAVAVLVVCGFIAHALQGLIGPVAVNGLANSPQRFLSQAGQEAIDWQPLDERVFSRARNRGLPILLVAGSGDSWQGRLFDKQVLTNIDVASRLRRSFLCARVDSEAEPRWCNGLQPVSRVMLDPLADEGVYVLTPEGKLASTYLPAKPGFAIDYRTFLAFLNSAERSIGQPNQADVQAQEVSDLRTASGPGLPDFQRHLAELVQFDNPNGGFPAGMQQYLLPLAWRYFLIEGRFDAFHSSLDPVLLSPAVNWLDGGFFRGSNSADWTMVEFDESAELDAELMWTLALADSVFHDPLYRFLAEKAFDRLVGGFGTDGWVAAYQSGDEDLNGRSTRYSFPPRAIRDLFPAGAERDWVQQNLQMRVSVNPLMVPQLDQKSIWLNDRDRFQRVLDVLRKAATAEPVYGGAGILEVNGLVAARLQACARLWNDAVRLRQATELAVKLDVFRVGDGVFRTFVSGVSSPGMLPDYLGYADACLETFLATARLDRFREGIKVLRRAIEVFGDKEPGVFAIDASPGMVLPANNPPEILDHDRASCSAWLARLALAYGTLAGKGGSDLVKVAYSVVSRYSSLANGLGPWASGYFLAAAQLSRSEAALCSGPQSLQLAQDLYRRSPTRLIAIAGGDVRSDLDKRAPGIYIVRGSDVRGPFSASEAAKLLPFAFPFDAATP